MSRSFRFVLFSPPSQGEICHFCGTSVSDWTDHKTSEFEASLPAMEDGFIVWTTCPHNENENENN